MMAIVRTVGGLIVLLVLIWVVKVHGQFVAGARYNPYTGGGARGAAGYNPYTGTRAAGRNYYNPYTGTRAASRSYYNPYTGNAGRATARYNPYTGNYAYRYRYRR